MAKRKVRQQRRGQPAPPAGSADEAERAEAAAAAGVEPAGEATGSGRRRPSGGQLAGLGAAILALVAIVAGAIVLASDAESEEDREGYLDGVVVVSEEDRLVLRLSEPVDGEDQVEMTIRPKDAEAVDIEHLDYHQVQGDVFRIHYERRGDQYFATLAEDLPGLGH